MQAGHARALEAAGILSAPEASAIGAALRQIESSHGGSGCPDSPAEDIHTWIESALIDIAGEAGKKIHTARSRNDQVATLLKMYVITAGETLRDKLRDLTAVFARRAQDWSDLVFPLQTHCQFAAPGSVGFWALRYAASFDRARRHVTSCLDLWREFCPLGAGAVCGSSIPIDRTIQAKELGFAQPSANALDATSTRDECVEYLSLATQVGLHLQSLAADVIAFSQTPFGWTVYPRAFGTGSSMMPNKTNPDAMELLRGECNAIAAAHAQAVMLLKGLPSGYNRDLQCVKPLLRQAAEKTNELCDMTAAFVEALGFNAERLEQALRLGAIDATLRMEQMVREGMPVREAHHAVAEALKNTAETNDRPAGAEDYRTLGGASPAETRRVAGAMLKAIDGDR